MKSKLHSYTAVVPLVLISSTVTIPFWGLDKGGHLSLPIIIIIGTMIVNRDTIIIMLFHMLYCLCTCVGSTS